MAKDIKAKPNLVEECKWWGIGLLIAGLIPFIFPEILDIYIGLIALTLGIITLVSRKKWNLAMIGIFIILVGALNIISVLTFEIEPAFLVGGIIQLLIGIGALNQYHKIKVKEPDKKERKVWYKRWWVIVILIIAGLIVFNYYFFSPKSYLRGEGYEVTSFYCADKDWTEESVLEGISSVDMMSLGDREDQIIDGLISISQACPPSKTFYITILEPTKECLYAFNGEVVRLWFEGIGQDLVISEESKKIIQEDSHFFFWETNAKYYYQFEMVNGISNMTIQQMSLSSAYKDYLKNGITRNTLHSMIYDYEINSRSTCE